MNYNWHFWIFNVLFNGCVSIGKFTPTLDTIKHEARIRGWYDRKGEVNLIDQVRAYRELAGGKNTCSLVEARDYIWVLNGREIPNYP